MKRFLKRLSVVRGAGRADSETVAVFVFPSTLEVVVLTGSTILGAGASSGYAADPAMMRNATSAPKEIGYLQRIEGLSAGLAEIDGRLMAFAGRLTGQGRTEGGPEPAPIGLEGVLAQAEQRVRAILQTLGHINDAF